MKRKVIKQGHNTLTITLPSKWCAENKINPGDEIPILLENNNITIMPEIKTSEKEDFVEVKKVDVHTISKILISLFESGKNTVRLKYDGDTLDSWYHGELPTMNTISHYVGRLVGFEIISQTKDSVTITNISENLTKFDQLLSRTFFIMEEAIEQAGEFIKQNHTNGTVIAEEVHDNIAKFSSLMIRTLSLSREPRVKLINLISIITLVDKMADFIRYIYRNAGNIKKASESIIKMNNLLLDSLKKYRSFYYDFSYDKIKLINSVRGEMKSLLKELKNKDELIVAGYMEAISECINGLIKPRISIHLSEE